MFSGVGSDILDKVFTGIGEICLNNILILSFSYKCKQINMVKHSQFVINANNDFS